MAKQQQKTSLAVTGRGGTAPGIQWVGARVAAKHPMMHRTGSTEKNYAASNVGTEVEKPCPG